MYSNIKYYFKCFAVSFATIMFTNQIIYAHAKNICVAPFGGTHMQVYSPIVKEVMRRGHNVSIFASIDNTKTIRKIVGSSSNLLHYTTYEGGKIKADDIGLIASWYSSRVIELLLGTLTYFVISAAVKEHQKGITSALISSFTDSSCDVLLADAFQWQMIDLATSLNIPVVASLTEVFGGYPNSILPAPNPLYLGQSITLGERIALQMEPYVKSMVGHIAGTMYYGYPRHMLSSVFARPFITPIGSNSIATHIPRNAIVLGPYNLNVALAESNDVIPSNQFQDYIDVSSSVIDCGQRRPLVVRGQKLLVASFGTIVKVPHFAASNLCNAFRLVLDSGEVDKVVFSRRPLWFQDTDRDIKQCFAPPELSACNDERIWSTTWINQTELFSSGAVGLFLTHGGFSSTQEAIAAQIPMVMLPVIGDQIENSYLAVDSGIAESIKKHDTKEGMANAMLKVLRNSDLYLKNVRTSIRSAAISAGLLKSTPMFMIDGAAKHGVRKLIQVNSAAEKGADLLELVAEEGVDNSLQRLVPAMWSHYAHKGGPSFFSFAFMGATFYLLIAVAIVCLPVLLISRGTMIFFKNS